MTIPSHAVRIAVPSHRPPPARAHPPPPATRMTRRVIRARAVQRRRLDAVIGSSNVDLVAKAMRSPLAPALAREIRNVGGSDLEKTLREVIAAPVDVPLSPAATLGMTLFADVLGKPTGQDVVLTRGFADPGALIREEAYGHLLAPYWESRPHWATPPTAALRVVSVDQASLVKARQGAAFWVPRFISDEVVGTLAGPWGWPGRPSFEDVARDGNELRDVLFKAMGDARKQRKDLVLWFSDASPDDRSGAR